MKQISILEYVLSVIALIVIMFVMALVSVEYMRMIDGLKIVYFTTLPLMIVRTFRKKTKYFIYLVMYLSLMLFIYR